ncbi:unnamed protein product, partial [Aureobasidium vineae]
MASLIRPALTASGRRTVAPFRPACRCLHNSSSRTATPLPHPIAAGPPPQPPQAPVTETEDRVARKRQQAALLARQAQIKVDPAKPASALRKRFWKESSVKETPDHAGQATGQNRFEGSPHPAAHQVRPCLGHCTRMGSPHIGTTGAEAPLHPLTSLSSRAIDIHNADLQGDKKIRRASS